MLLLDDVPTTRKVFHRVHLASRHYLALPRCPLFRAEKKGDPVLETGPWPSRAIGPSRHCAASRNTFLKNIGGKQGLNIRQSNLSSSKFDTVFCIMADRWASPTGNYPFRFFSPEQIDRILREGVKRGRTGSHDAIERILKHEPSLGRAELWRQIRLLKQPSNGKLYQRTAWSPEDDQILRKGYEAGWKGKREAVRALLRRHPGWQSHSIWGRASKLGLVRKTPQKNRLRSRQLWTEDDDRVLLTMAGYKTTEFIAKALHRSENAVRYRLAVLGKSSRVHLEGYARRTLAKELHLGSRTIQRLIVQGLLEVRDPRITRKSMEDACKTGRLTVSLHDRLPDATESAAIASEEGSASTPSTNEM